MLRSIIDAIPESDSRLRVVYSNGDTVKVDFKPLIAQGGVFAPLGDAEFFKKVSIGEHGRYIQWPGELDFCADALWLQEHAADSPAA